jgi:hypothetical protein
MLSARTLAVLFVFSAGLGPSGATSPSPAAAALPVPAVQVCKSPSGHAEGHWDPSGQRTEFKIFNQTVPDPSVSDDWTQYSCIIDCPGNDLSQCTYPEVDKQGNAPVFDIDVYDDFNHDDPLGHHVRRKVFYFVVEKMAGKALLRDRGTSTVVILTGGTATDSSMKYASNLERLDSVDGLEKFRTANIIWAQGQPLPGPFASILFHTPAGRLTRTDETEAGFAHMWDASARVASVVQFISQAFVDAYRPQGYRLGTQGCSGGAMAMMEAQVFYGLDGIIDYQLFAGGPYSDYNLACAVTSGRCERNPAFACGDNRACVAATNPQAPDEGNAHATNICGVYRDLHIGPYPYFQQIVDYALHTWGSNFTADILKPRPGVTGGVCSFAPRCPDKGCWNELTAISPGDRGNALDSPDASWASTHNLDFYWNIAGSVANPFVASDGRVGPMSNGWEAFNQLQMGTNPATGAPAVKKFVLVVGNHCDAERLNQAGSDGTPFWSNFVVQLPRPQEAATSSGTLATGEAW